MFKDWLIDDIEKAMRKVNRVVISDPKGFLTFMVKQLPQYDWLTLSSNKEEMQARSEAQTGHKDRKVIFLCFFPKTEIKHLLEFAGVGGHVEFDNPDNYLRSRLFKELNQNVTIPEETLLLSAKLSAGKDIVWWRGIVNETVQPMDVKEHLHELILDPEAYQTFHDEDIFSYLRKQLFNAINKPTLQVNAPSLLKELVSSIFTGLLSNNLSPKLEEIYKWWTNTSDIITRLKEFAAEYTIPASVSPLSANHDHPFEELDKRLIARVADCLRNNTSLEDIKDYLHKRIQSGTARQFKPEWLKDLSILLNFDTSGIYRFDTYPKILKYYIEKFTHLDAAMRHLYNQWLADPDLLRPLQELYETSLKSLNKIWFEVAPREYAPSQLNLVADALTSDEKVAVLVCDGLRLEIADCIAGRLGSSVISECRKEFAKLPSVTENGMSALFGLDIPEYQTAPRYDKLKTVVPDAKVVKISDIGSTLNHNKLVIMFGDIDHAGEEKGMAALHDINNYEVDLTETVKRLLRLGYNAVFITADHGFVITGILDEASKVPAPAGIAPKERFFVSDQLFNDNSLIRREDNFPGGTYQYYTKTDRPFRSRGAYGYAHGGFTPQECIIPFYKFSTASSASTVNIEISNKENLSAVTGQYFTVRIKGNEASVGKRIKVILFDNSRQVASSIVRLDDSAKADAEFELSANQMSIVLQDTETGNQYDNAIVKKSQSRDLDDLF